MPATKRPSLRPSPRPIPRPEPAAPLPSPLRPQPDVILDVEVDAGALHFVLASIGPAPAHGVRVRFSRALRDLAGLRLNDNPLFTQLEFIGPGRRVRLFVDTLDGYVRRRQPLAFEVRLEWRNDDGERCRRTLKHNLAAWTQLRETV